MLLAENLSGSQLIRIRQIDEEISRLEQQIRQLKGQKEALLSTKSHRPVGSFVAPIPKQTTPTKIKLVPSKVHEESVIRYAKDAAEKNSKGGFLGKGKIEEKAVAWQRFWYPYHDVKMSITIRETEKRGWFAKEEVVKTLESRTSIDGMTGAIVNVKDNFISYMYAFLKNLNMDEIYLLYYVSNLSGFTIKDLRGLPQTEAKSRKIADGLAAKGILRRIDTRPAQYRPQYDYPSNPALFVSLMEKYSVMEDFTTDKIFEPRISTSSLASDLSRYWNKCSILSSEIIYYPYYGITFEREDNSRIEIIDGVHATRQEYIEKVIAIERQNLIDNDKVKP